MKFGEGLTVALITGTAAVGGAWVGGYMSAKSAEKVENRQVRQEEVRRVDSARAVARMLMAEYQKDAKRVQEMIGEEHYLPIFYRRRAFVSRIGLEDRKLLAGELSEHNWLAVAEASNSIEEVEAVLEAHDGKGSVYGEDLETLETAGAACTHAYKALTALVEGASAS